jgi:hypothetical protein
MIGQGHVLDSVSLDLTTAIGAIRRVVNIPQPPPDVERSLPPKQFEKNRRLRFPRKGR